MFLRRSSSLRLVRPSPRANSERRDLETLGTSLFGDADWKRDCRRKRREEKRLGFHRVKGSRGNGRGLVVVVVWVA